MSHDRELRDLILAFVGEFDVPLRHGEAMAEFYRRSAFDLDMQALTALPTDDDARRRFAERVGAFACRLYICDVQYHLAEARMIVFWTMQDADRLEVYCRSCPHPDPFEVYAVARWLDASGRVFYRLGDKTRARLYFERAAKALAVQVHRTPQSQIDITTTHTPTNMIAAAWDVVSNFLRSEFEEVRQQNLPMVHWGNIAKALRKFTDSARVQPDAVRDLNAHPELRRGRINLLHNTILTIRDYLKELERRKIPREQYSDGAVPWDSTDDLTREIKQLLSCAPDPYRQAQWDLQEVQRATSLDNSALARLKNSAWPRGRLIARQREAIIAGKLAIAKDSSPGSQVEQLLDLVDELDAVAERSGSRDAADVEVRRWTCESAIELCSASGQSVGTQSVEKALRDRLYATRLRVARTVREVTSVAQYKASYQQKLAPILREAAQERLNAKKLDESLSLLEEAECGEYLDLVACSQSRQSGTASQTVEALFAATTSFASRVEVHSSAVKDIYSERAASTPISEESFEQVRNAIIPLLQREHEYWLRNPLPTSPPDPDIHAAAKSETLSSPGLAIIRFATFSKDAYRAFVYFDGTLIGAPIDIESEWIRRTIDDVHASPHQVPSDTAARELWNNCLAGCFERCRGVQRAVIVPAAALATLPFQAATVPANYFGPHKSAPLGALLPISFTTSLTAFLTRNRKRFRLCRCEPTDDLWAMHQIETAKKEFESVGGDLIKRAKIVPANRHELFNVVESKPEFLVFFVHGYTGSQRVADGDERDMGTGPYLEFQDGWVTSAGMALTPWLRRNKLTVLGACHTSRPSLEPAVNNADGGIPGFVRAFSAAGAGALLLVPWAGLCRQIGMVSAEVLRQVVPAEGTSAQVCQLDELLRNAHAQAIRKFATIRAIENCLFQLWL